jgi:hypothetical protein
MEEERFRASTWHGPARAVLLYGYMYVNLFVADVQTLLVSKRGRKCRQ